MSHDEIRDDVLYAFAVEPNRNRETLDRYLKKYPQFSEELIDLSSELRLGEAQPKVKGVVDDPGCQEAWSKFTSTAKAESALANPFARFRGAGFVSFCDSLRLPRSIVVALRDRLVEPASIPERLVAAIAGMAHTTSEVVRQYLAQQPTTITTMEFKANQKPVEIERTTFQALIDSTELSEKEQKAVTEYLEDDQSG